jgi:hypothetical protein
VFSNCPAVCPQSLYILRTPETLGIKHTARLIYTGAGEEKAQFLISEFDTVSE